MTNEEKYRKALEQISCIRDSIIGHQTANISAHIYPLVQALKEAGFEGRSYNQAKAELVEHDEGYPYPNKTGYELLREQLEPLGLFCGSLGSKEKP